MILMERGDESLTNNLYHFVLLWWWCRLLWSHCWLGSMGMESSCSHHRFAAGLSTIGQVPMNVSILTTLIEARRLINNGWSQKTFAQDGKGNMCDWRAKRAESFCSVGALYKATTDGRTYDSCANILLCDEVFKVLAVHIDPYHTEPSSCIVTYNDAKGRTKEEVLAAFDKAISAYMNDIDVAAPMVVMDRELEFT